MKAFNYVLWMLNKVIFFYNKSIAVKHIILNKEVAYSNNIIQVDSSDVMNLNQYNMGFRPAGRVT